MTVQNQPNRVQAGTLVAAGAVLLVGGCATVFLHGDSKRFMFLDTLGGIAFVSGWALVILGVFLRRFQ